VNIETHTRPPFHIAEPAWNLCRRSFAEINALAVQRHALTPDEFMIEWNNDRIEKWFARDDDGDVVGMGVQTTDLDAWPLISPVYFERKWPKLYAERKIWYVGFVCTRQDPPAPISTFAEIITAMSEPTRQAGGISVMDYCTVNVGRGLPKGALRILKRSREETTMEAIDQQTFVAYDFGENGN
jgi:hypothetical protein